MGSPWASAGRSCLSRCRRCLGLCMFILSGCWCPSLTTTLRQAQHRVASAILTQMAQVSAHLVPSGSATDYCGHYYCLSRWFQHLLACPNSQSWRSNLILALAPLWTFCWAPRSLQQLTIITASPPKLIMKLRSSMRFKAEPQYYFA